MANKEQVPAGKVRVYYYIRDKNKKLLEERSKLAEMSESKVLDLILDKLRKTNEKFSVSV